MCTSAALAPLSTRSVAAMPVLTFAAVSTHCSRGCSDSAAGRASRTPRPCCRTESLASDENSTRGRGRGGVEGVNTGGDGRGFTH